MAANISFHCIICFDHFNNTTNYPVVLPCGHTYICCKCADRLDKCMECRTSLFLPENKPVSSGIEREQRQHSSRYRQRRVTHNYSSASIQTRSHVFRQIPQAQSTGSSDTETKQNSSIKPERKRYPLPKNLVLMSLIEVSNNAGKNEKKALQIINNRDQPIPNAEKDECENEDENINFVASLTSSACGTYQVKSNQTVKLYPLTKNEQDRIRTNTKLGKKSTEMENNSKVFSQKNIRNVFDEMDLNIDYSFYHAMNDDDKTEKLNSLNSGDKIQVVAIIDNWAMLARKRGFVYADKLIKVGGPDDEVCRLEGALYSLIETKKHFSQQLSQSLIIFEDLRKDIKKALTNDYPVIKRAPIQETNLPKISSSEDKSDEQSNQNTATVSSQCKILNNQKIENRNQRHSTNFRTGMSGHHALAHYVNVRREDEQKSRHSRMSNHSGLSIPRNIYKSIFNTFSADERDTGFCTEKTV